MVEEKKDLEKIAGDSLALEALQVRACIDSDKKLFAKCCLIEVYSEIASAKGEGTEGTDEGREGEMKASKR